jgi:hypothetical protein
MMHIQETTTPDEGPLSTQTGDSGLAASTDALHPCPTYSVGTKRQISSTRLSYQRS